MFIDDYEDLFYDKGFLIALIVIRFIIAFYCSNRAKKLKRNEFGWFIFGFALPLVAVVIIQFLKPRFVWDSIAEKRTHNYEEKKSEYKISISTSSQIIFWIGFVFIFYGLFEISRKFLPDFDSTYLAPLFIVSVGLVLLFKKPNKPG